MDLREGGRRAVKIPKSLGRLARTERPSWPSGSRGPSAGPHRKFQGADDMALFRLWRLSGGEGGGRLTRRKARGKSCGDGLQLHGVLPEKSVGARMLGLGPKRTLWAKRLRSEDAKGRAGFSGAGVRPRTCLRSAPAQESMTPRFGSTPLRTHFLNHRSKQSL